MLAVSLLFFDQPVSGMVNLPELGGHRQEKIFLVCLVACLLTMRRAPRIPWQFLLLTLWVTYSLSWAADPGADWQQVEEVLLFVVSGAAIAANLDTDQVIRTIHRTSLLAAVVSLALGRLMPGISHDTEYGYAGALHGIYVQKNLLGMVMLLGAIAVLHRPVRDAQDRLVLLGSLGLYLVVILYADSATSLGLFCIAIVFRFLHGRVGARSLTSRLDIFSFLLFVPFLAVPLWEIFAPSIFHLLGRNSSLTGRSSIWQGTVAAWHAHEWVGYGWGEFTHNPQLVAIFSNYNDIGDIANAHNGYLQVLVLLGIVGLALLGLAVFRLARDVFRLTLMRNDLRRGWLVTVTVIVLLYNLDENFITGMPLMILVIAACHMRTEIAADAAEKKGSRRDAIRQPPPAASVPAQA